MSKNQMKLSVIYVWSNCNRGGTLSMPQKLAVVPKNIQSHLQTKSKRKYITLLFFAPTLVPDILKMGVTLSPFYSAPSIFAVLRNLVWEIWFKKFGSRIVKKRWFYSIDLAFFRLEKSGWPEKKIRVCRTSFLEPLFYT